MLEPPPPLHVAVQLKIVAAPAAAAAAAAAGAAAALTVMTSVGSLLIGMPSTDSASRGCTNIAAAAATMESAKCND
jgi:hypothetical protein